MLRRHTSCTRPTLTTLSPLITLSVRTHPRTSVHMNDSINQLGSISAVHEINAGTGQELELMFTSDSNMGKCDLSDF